MRASTLLIAAAASLAVDASYLQYSTEQTGLFLQENTTITSIDWQATNLGLINRTYTTDATFDPTNSKTQWERFAYFVESLNSAAAAGVSYKVIYLIRHGEGYHNLAQTLYSASCWNGYWSQQNGNGNITWIDALLDPTGINQDLAANAFWTSALTNAKIPAPQTIYVSPLERCLESANLTFSTLPATLSLSPIVKEGLRENVTQCTCNYRSPKSVITTNFPSYTIETGFAETDPLWTAGQIESVGAQMVRRKQLLDDIFSSDNNTFISLTTHSGFVPSMLNLIGYPNPWFPLGTGQTVALLVKSELVAGDAPVVTVGAPTAATTTPATCT